MIIDIINDNWFYLAIEDGDWKWGWGTKILKILKSLPKSDRRYDFNNKRWAVIIEHRPLFNEFYRESLESGDEELQSFLAQFE